MRKFSIQFAFLLAASLVIAGSASAGPFTGGSFSFTIGTLPGLSAPIAAGFATDGTNVTATSTGAINGTDTFIGITNAPPITRVQVAVTGNQTGQLVPGAGTAANPLGVLGVANVVAYGGYVTLVGVPLSSVGIPGSSFSFMGGGGTQIAYTGAGWTTGVVTVMVPATTIAGMSDPANVETATFTGTNNLVGGSGSITFISPILIRTNLAGDLASFASLTLNFGPSVPEPGTLLLVGAGIAGLAVLGRQRGAL